MNRERCACACVRACVRACARAGVHSYIHTSTVKGSPSNLGACAAGGAGFRAAAFGFLTYRMLKRLADPAAPAAA